MKHKPGTIVTIQGLGDGEAEFLTCIKHGEAEAEVCHLCDGSAHQRICSLLPSSCFAGEFDRRIYWVAHNNNAKALIAAARLGAYIGEPSET